MLEMTKPATVTIVVPNAESSAMVTGVGSVTTGVCSFMPENIYTDSQNYHKFNQCKVKIWCKW